MIKNDKKILVVGASADLSSVLNKNIIGTGAKVGLHYCSNEDALADHLEGSKLKKFKKDLNSSLACHELVDDFVAWAGGIDGLVQLSGHIESPCPWQELTKEQWDSDISSNLIMPFFLAQRAISFMKKKGGKIIFTSTASAAHGGGTTSLAYGSAKAALECATKRLAKDCAQYNILVNAIAPGFIDSKFHTNRMHRSPEQLEKRAASVPLKRPGTSEEIAATIMFLLSQGANYITGEIISISGGDWI